VTPRSMRAAWLPSEYTPMLAAVEVLLELCVNYTPKRTHHSAIAAAAASAFAALAFFFLSRRRCAGAALAGCGGGGRVADRWLVIAAIGSFLNCGCASTCRNRADSSLLRSS